MVEVEGEPVKDDDHREREAIPEQNPLVEDEEVHLTMSLLSHSYLDMIENFPEPVESSRRGEGNFERMEMLRLIKKDMEGRVQRWEKQ